MFELHNGDCLDVLRGMADNSVDAIVTDPPYGLSFMGKRWDYDVPSVDIWAECLRVLKPGGHLLAFAGTRTQHRMAVRIEDAGFEIRDMIAWVYASGFPKSMDVSKAIDKGHGENRERQLQFTAWMRSTGITARQIDDITGTKMGNHYTTHPTQPAIATADMFDKLRPYLPEVPEYIERLVCERTGLEWKAYKQREVVGHREVGFAPGTNAVYGQYSGDTKVTAPATDAAKQWHGWGTALKPALEPITVARKPLIGTVAENVLTWGTGGVNVEGCRVGTEEIKTCAKTPDASPMKGLGASGFASGVKESTHTGRWPANLIHDGSEEVVGLFPHSKSTGGQSSLGAFRNGDVYGKGRDERWGDNPGYGDSGSAARFFYCAKASKRDRDEGCEGMEAKARPTMGSGIGGQPDQSKPNNRNHHPTVKPTDLMRYLCRLVTPPGGTVLDPFMGSGSTGKGAILEGFNFIGIEREAEYLDIARARIEHVTKEPNLWQQHTTAETSGTE